MCFCSNPYACNERFMPVKCFFRLYYSISFKKFTIILIRHKNFRFFYMKILLALLFSLSLCPIAKGDVYQRGYSRSRTCTRNEYREEYVPGTQDSPGFVKSWNETIEVPCNGKTNAFRGGKNPQGPIDTNDCSEGTLIGGLLGAGLATSSSRGKDRWWAIPAGAVGGAMLGCQIDGG